MEPKKVPHTTPFPVEKGILPGDLPFLSWIRKGELFLVSFGNRLFTSRYNPLYQTGTIAVLSFFSLLLSGIFLIVFYRPSSPYESVRHTVEDIFLGKFFRSIHRYSADLMVVAILLHGIRIFFQGRFQWRQYKAWIVGILLLFVVHLIGWTGFLLPWDIQAGTLAEVLFRFLDYLPLFSEPLERMVGGGIPPSPSFFFFFLFLHIALPLGGTLLFYLHTRHLNAPTIFPPKNLALGILLSLIFLSILFPPPLPPPLNPFQISDQEVIDLWYGFFLLLIPILGEGGTFLAGSLGILSAILLPRLFPKNTLPPAKVNEDLCTGCTQCYLDCPYMAIEMVPRPTTQKREEPIAKVYDDLCVRCGICIGSCAPMFMGPPKRSGRDQLLWIQKNRWDPPEGVLFRCGIGTESIHLPEGVLEIVTDCSGGIHTTTIETLLRKGVKKIGIVPCPERDCKNRFGVRWLKERIFSGREAELSLRVDRERILLLPIGPGEGKKEEEKIVTFFLKKNEEPLPPPEEIQCEPKPFPKKRRWLPI